MTKDKYIPNSKKYSPTNPNVPFWQKYERHNGGRDDILAKIKNYNKTPMNNYSKNNFVKRPGS